MPVMQCTSGGKPGYKWGHSGHCYTYTSGDKASMVHAHEQAVKQGQAEHANGGKSKKPSGNYPEKPDS